MRRRLPPPEALTLRRAKIVCTIGPATRSPGMADGLLPNRVKLGVACYVSGYHPLFVVASSLRRITQKPYLIGSAAYLFGFLRAYWTQPPRVKDRPYVAYIRGQQLRRLFGMQTIWR